MNKGAELGQAQPRLGLGLKNFSLNNAHWGLANVKMLYWAGAWD